MSPLNIKKPALVSPPIALSGTHNLRSTAGYEAEGGHIARNSLLRSDALHLISAEGADALQALGIVRVIDLRDSSEVAQAPDRLAEQEFEIIHHPIFAGAAIPSRLPVPSLQTIYQKIITDRIAQLCAAVGLVADAPPGGVLVHCTAGKDRTGMVIAVALLAVGVSEDQVLDDYAASSANLSGAWAPAKLAEVAARLGSIDQSVYELVSESPADALRAALELITVRYGGVVPMLRTHGVSEDQLARLRARLITPATP